MSAAASVIKLLPPSAAFVNARTNSLGPWARTYFRTRTRVQSTLHQFYKWLVIVVLALSMLKTAQCMGVVWVQNVLDYANPDVARLLVAKAWWQVSMPLMILYAVVKLDALRTDHLCDVSWSGWSLSFDFLITAGTVYMLRKHVDSGLERTTQLINRLLCLVFESAVPPTLIAMTDLIMTQTLGPKLLWHLFMNIAYTVSPHTQTRFANVILDWEKYTLSVSCTR
ncbi:hypothetical protein B0H14DRAFT_2574837 [Mycena olivaceomarginata]|nr:hypothetical protein B0H14DRAFT_2574837 [Mycena olivaceomarginata]